MVNTLWINSRSVIHFLSSLVNFRSIHSYARRNNTTTITDNTRWEFFENYANALFRGAPEGYGARVPVMQMMINSAIMAIGITVGKIVISLLSAFAFVYFRFPFRNLCFWLIFITLMLPVEVRIVPTYEVVANLNLLNSYTGLIFPLIASATANF